MKRERERGREREGEREELLRKGGRESGLLMGRGGGVVTYHGCGCKSMLC